MPEFKEAKRWQELGSKILIEQLPIHVQRDGVYFEQSSYYHRYTTDFYLHFLLLARANHLAAPPQIDEDLLLLLDHLMYITRPDGTTPLFGDDDGGRLRCSMFVLRMIFAGRLRRVPQFSIVANISLLPETLRRSCVANGYRGTGPL